MSITPQRYTEYEAIVRYHKAPDQQPAPEEGQRLIVLCAWKMSEDDPFPGEFAFTISEPAHFPFWMPERDLILGREIEPIGR